MRGNPAGYAQVLEQPRCPLSWDSASPAGFFAGFVLQREYLGKWPDIVTSAMIMGTDNQPGVVLSIMMATVKEQIQKGGFDDPTDRVRELSFRDCNQNS